MATRKRKRCKNGLRRDGTCRKTKCSRKLTKKGFCPKGASSAGKRRTGGGRRKTTKRRRYPTEWQKLRQIAAYQLGYRKTMPLIGDEPRSRRNYGRGDPENVARAVRALGGRGA